MLGWIVSSSVLIVGVFGLRRLLRGRISLRLQYALWLVVLIRLLCPVSFFESNMSVYNAVDSLPEYSPGQSIRQPEYEQEYQPESGNPGQNWDNEEPLPPASDVTPFPDAEAVMPEPDTQGTVTSPKERPSEDWGRVAYGVWAAGALLMMAFMLGCNFQFNRMLKRTRSALEVSLTSVPVYVSPWVKTPCLAGVFRPVIYLTPETASDPGTWNHVIGHELTHMEHFDHGISLLRCAALCLHWYNPLVWMAARVSKEDAELACDEGTIARLGEGERIGYGETLIRLTCRSRGPSDLLITATTMIGSSGGIKERIRCIAKQRKTVALALAACVIVVGVLLGCTFTGAKEDPAPTEPTETVPMETTEPEETTVPVETTEPVTQVSLLTSVPKRQGLNMSEYTQYMASLGFEQTETSWGNEYLYTGESNEILFRDVGLHLTIPEGWKDQVEIIWYASDTAGRYTAYVVNRHLAEEYHGFVSRMSHIIRFDVVRKMYSTTANPYADREGSDMEMAWNYLGENEEFYFYYTTAEMTGEMDSPMFWKSFIVKDYGQAYYDDLVGGLIVDPKDAPGWVEIMDAGQEFPIEPPPQTLPGHPEFQWTGVWTTYRYTGTSDTIDFPEWDLSLKLPEGWLERVDVLYVWDYMYTGGVYLVGKDMTQAFVENSINNPYYVPHQTDFILNVYSCASPRNDGWRLTSTVFAETRELRMSDPHLVFGVGKTALIKAVGEEEYYKLIGDLVVDEQMLREMILLHNGGEITYVDVQG